MNFGYGPLCTREDCHRDPPHYPKEYGCVESQVWRCLEGGAFTQCYRTQGTHVRGCGCDGDPLQGIDS